MTSTLFSLEIRPIIPEKIQRLNELANNLIYSWDSQVRDLFIRLDPKLWHQCGHNPKVFLRRIAQEKLNTAAQDRIYIQEYTRVLLAYDAYINEQIRPEVNQLLDPMTDLVAYFCAEFGFHESFPIYSGGLGILAGDHCKAASDLGVPFVAIGLLYRKGYFNQTIDGHGTQQAHYFQTDPCDLPITPAVSASDDEIHVHVAMLDRKVELKVWQAKVGHITLYLLDSDLPSNTPEDRGITHQLYGGDRNTRLQQEIVLGIGGVRALSAVGLKPTAWHINEGHAAFMILERTRILTEQGLDFDSALEMVASGTVFTTHTPVSAGHDIFDHGQIWPYFKDFVKTLGIDQHRFFAFGAYPNNPHGFNMTALALRGSQYHNGVSRIHGGVASQMESYIWPDVPAEENPIDYVTNGVHVSTFLAPEWMNQFDMQFGGGWRNELLNPYYWEIIDDIPDHSFWSIRQTLKANLMSDIYRRIDHQHRRNGCSSLQIERLTQHICSQGADVLTIGFARRFATYKRATLLFSDPERLARLVNDPKRPVRIVFAGKAHPHDEPGQQMLKTIYEYSRRPEFEGKIILLEGYDLALARKLVTGVDVWLNTPEYPMEASGTSGEKAGINGVLNLSVLDGWWGEGYDGENGWAITPHGATFDADFVNREEAHELLDILETKVIPLYYHRDEHGYSSAWVKKSKTSMKTLMPCYNSQRMVMDYVRKYYSSACKQQAVMVENDFSPAKELAKWKKKINQAWKNVRIHRLDTPPVSIHYNETLSIEISAYLNGLDAQDVYMECLIGTSNTAGEFITQHIYRLDAVDANSSKEALFKIELNSPLAGLQQYKIRIYPYHKLLNHRFSTGHMLWL